MTPEPSPERWTLRTATSTYVLTPAPARAGLVLEHWGAPGPTRPWSAPDRLHFATVLDAAPLEYAAVGTRHTAFSELIVQRPDGNDGVALRLAEDGVRIDRDGHATRLRAVLTDPAGGVTVTLHVVTSTHHDVVERWAEVSHVGSADAVLLTRVFSAGWNIPVGPGVHVHALVGEWSREFQPVEVELGAGEFSLGSRQGVTSHRYSPLVVLQTRGPSDGVAYGVALAWSGSWRMVVDATPFQGHVRVSGGLDDETTVVRLDPGERFETPHMLGIWSPHGPTGLSHAWHTYQREVLARDSDAQHRPVVFNSWYATGFDVRADHQRALADRAARIGAEVFVVDDGWFERRTSDRSGLGDWFVDAVKFPQGLEELVDGVLGHGMRFGLWVEPEAVSPDSDLYRTHPDWVYRAGDRPLTTVRNQYVLDLGRADVERWVADMLSRLLTTYPISYLKWDMNRPVTDGGRPGDPHGREWSIQHTRAYLRLMATLRSDFPQVTVEACAGGGGRIDNAVLGVCDVVWPSDETGPRDRLAIQHGFLSAFAPSVMGSWVTDEPDRVETGPASLEFRFVVAMAGVLGIGADLMRWGAARMQRAAALLELYREIRPTVHRGAVFRHGSPADDWYAVQYNTEAQVVLLVWARGSPAPAVRIRVLGLQPSQSYRLRGSDLVLSGSGEAAPGLTVPFSLASDCDVLVLEPVDE